MLAEIRDGDWRLNRFLALCGLGSRRQVEKTYIEAKRVKLNGTLVTEPGTRVGASDSVSIDGKPVTPRRSVYLVLHKPPGTTCAVRDRFSPTVMDLLPPDILAEALFPVGRLDKNSEGLLLLTNDGQFMQDLIHPSKGIHKTYEVLLDKRPTSQEILLWKQGITIEGKFVRPIQVRQLGGNWIGVTLGEGIKREIRLMAQKHGFGVLRLIRRSIGQLVLSKLPRGQFIELEKTILWKMINEGGIV